MFSCKFPSVLAFRDLLAHQSHAFLMQTRKFFCKYSHGDLTAIVLFLETFVLYGKCIGNRIFDMSYQLNGESSIRVYTYTYIDLSCQYNALDDIMLKIIGGLFFHRYSFYQYHN